MLLFPLSGLCQSAIGVQLQHGVTRMITGPDLTYHRPGHAAALGVSVLLKRPRQRIEFEPSLLLCKSSFAFKLSEGVKLRLAQRALRLVLLSAIPCGKNKRIKAGLFMQAGHASVISLRSTAGSFYAYSSNDLFAGYSAQELQAGLSAGFSFLVGEKKRASFDLVADVHATPVVMADYRFLSHTSAIKDMTVYSTKALPLALKAGFTFRFLKRKIRDEVENGA